MPPILVACTMTSHSIFHKAFWVECWLLSTPLPWSLLNIQPERSLKSTNQTRTLLGSLPNNPSPDMKIQILWRPSVVTHCLPCPQIPLLIWSAYYSPPLNPSISTPHQGHSDLGYSDCSQFLELSSLGRLRDYSLLNPSGLCLDDTLVKRLKLQPTLSTMPVLLEFSLSCLLPSKISQNILISIKTFDYIPPSSLPDYRLWSAKL